MAAIWRSRSMPDTSRIYISDGGDPIVLTATYIAHRRPAQAQMPDYTYLIVGGGMTADAAAQALHEADPAGSVGLISAEPHPPYDRPPLSKALWKGEPEEKIWRKTAATGATLHLGRRITAIDPRLRLCAAARPPLLRVPRITDIDPLGPSLTADRGTKCRFTKFHLPTRCA